MTPWTSDRPLRSPFGLPLGLRGRLAGLFMWWTNPQQDLFELLNVRPGERVLEIGYGPGRLISLLAASPAGRVCGVDPSPQMRAFAARRNRGQVAAGRVDLRVGTAESTGFPDAEFHCVVSVNNVGLWPRLEAGIAEMYRVTRPGGRVVIAWHGGTGRSPLARRLAMPEERLGRVERALGAAFSDVTRREIPHLTLFEAVR
ncbi:class I SAM-dependent methyltransferase [Actinomadura viridis]|uniref:class I SAM-dependent methyltransferase n=1 Tax=Actinomadura viridis TaxID=58110 RepID=UPI0036CB3CC1